MSNYTPIVNYAAKDALLTGDPAKKILGTEITAELASIAAMSVTKEDTANKNIANGYAGLDASAFVLDARLATNVPRKDATGTITAAWTFSTSPTFSAAVQLPSIELGHASDTTLTRVSPGVIAVEGNTLLSQGVASIELSHASANTLTGASGVLSIEGHAIPTVDQGQTISAVYAFTATPTLNGLSLGYMEVPQNAQTGNYNIVLADNGKHIYHASGAGAGDTYTIPANASVAFPIGATLTFVNSDSNNVSIAITTDTLTLAGTTTTGTRTLGQNGIATAIKVTSTSWIISGTGLS